MIRRLIRPSRRGSLRRLRGEGGGGGGGGCVVDARPIPALELERFPRGEGHRLRLFHSRAGCLSLFGSFVGSSASVRSGLRFGFVRRSPPREGSPARLLEDRDAAAQDDDGFRGEKQRVSVGGEQGVGDGELDAGGSRRAQRGDGAVLVRGHARPSVGEGQLHHAVQARGLLRVALVVARGDVQGLVRLEDESPREDARRRLGTAGVRIWAPPAGREGVRERAGAGEVEVRLEELEVARLHALVQGHRGEPRVGALEVRDARGDPRGFERDAELRQRIRDVRRTAAVGRSPGPRGVRAGAEGGRAHHRRHREMPPERREPRDARTRAPRSRGGPARAQI